MTEPIDNQVLYNLGRQWARGINCRRSARERLAAIRKVAKEKGEGVAKVRTACEFAWHVDALTNVVPAAHKMILAGHNPHLTPLVVANLIKKSAGAKARRRDVMRAAMQRAAVGLHPFAPLPPSGLDAGGILSHYDIVRFQKAASLLARAEAVVKHPGKSLRAPNAADLAVSAASVRVVTDAMTVVGLRGRENLGCVATSPASLGSDRQQVIRLAKRARRLVEKATGDVLRAAHTRGLTAVPADFKQAVHCVAGSARRILQTLPAPTPVVEPTVLEAPDGPLKIDGTYTIVYSAHDSSVVRLGRLGTFWLPAGYFLYVGSAFRSGGVAYRTDRHLFGTGPQQWNADHLRGFALAVERWWAHHDQKMECAWAMALAAMPNCSCPVPRFGANDCRRCPAHLFYSPTRPSCADFARRLGATGNGGYTVRWQEVSTLLTSRGDRV